jgi:hypothetical protein
MKILFRLVLIVYLILITSCTSGRLAVEPSQLNIDNPDAATVIVLRESQIRGGGGNFEILLDAGLIAYLGSGDGVKFQVEPGSHFIATGLSIQIFRNQGERVIRFNAEPNKTYYFYFNMRGGDKMYNFVQLSETEGKKALAEHEYNFLKSQ